MANTPIDPDLRPRSAGELIKGNLLIMLSTIFFGVNLSLIHI